MAARRWHLAVIDPSLPPSGKPIKEELEELRARSQWRELRPMAASGGVLEARSSPVLNFSSNDYLALSHHPRTLQGAAEALQLFGAGATSSRLMSGTLDLHSELEAQLAFWLSMDSALVFGSGFLANLGTLSALAGKGDFIFSDKFNHASLIDGMLASGAKWFRYRHCDVAHLQSLLESVSHEPGRKVIVTDSVFSMDGDIAPLKEIGALAREHRAYLVADEAHALGVFGKNGAGIASTITDEFRPDVILGTMSKSLGSYGGFVATSGELRDLLINRARSFIYSTGLPPTSAGASLAALGYIRERKILGEKLMRNVAQFWHALRDQGIDIAEPQSPIIPITIGANEATVTIAEELRARGILVMAIRPPTVAPGTARLRLSVTLDHSVDDLQSAATIIGSVVGKAIAS